MWHNKMHAFSMSDKVHAGESGLAVKIAESNLII